MGWLGIFRMGLVQSCLGAIVVLTTSTINRVMVVELMLPAMLPGILVGLHYVIQLSRPCFGHASDQLGRRTPWIIAGMTVLAIGGVLAATATAWMAESTLYGTLLAVFAFILIGGGVGAAGTSMLAMLAAHVPAQRRAAAGSIVWIMMITGFVITASTAGAFLDPFTTTRLIQVTACVAAIAWVVTLLALAGVERSAAQQSTTRTDELNPPDQQPNQEDDGDFRTALREVWRDQDAKHFTIFVFVSMLAYSTQDLILEPFAGSVFGMTPGESTQLSGLQNAGVLLGMLLVAVIATRGGATRWGSLRTWMVSGCVASSAALLALVLAAQAGPSWPLAPTVMALGVANGVFAVAAIGSMMALAGSGPKGKEGVRMGLWGAAQAIAFAIGGFFGTMLYDLLTFVGISGAHAYASAFAIEASIFLWAAFLATSIPQLSGGGAQRDYKTYQVWKVTS